MPLDFSNVNEIYHHPGQEQMQIEVILASRHADLPDEKPLYTVRLRYPRIIHGEVMTHRVFGRNARSSRAVPVKTMLNEVRTTPFIPWHWGKNQKGMQADEECNEWLKIGDLFPHESLEKCGPKIAWVEAARKAAKYAEAYMDAGYHKQIPNRLLEPFSWIDVLITSNQWDNFLWLRDHKDAEPHLQDLARLVKKALNEAKIQELQPGEWHLPYVSNKEAPALHRYWSKNISSEVNGSAAESVKKFLRKISAARCARISYAPFDGNASYERELERYDMLVTSERVHASPLEHQATPDTKVELIGSIGLEEGGYDHVSDMQWANPSLHGNLPGFIQARKLVPNEAYHG